MARIKQYRIKKRNGLFYVQIKLWYGWSNCHYAWFDEYGADISLARFSKQEKAKECIKAFRDQEVDRYLKSLIPYKIKE